MSTVTISRHDYPTIIELCAWDPGDDALAKALKAKRSLKLTLPAANASELAEDGSVMVLSVGTGRYWLMGEAANKLAISSEIASSVDLSSARTRFRVDGDGSRWLLNKGTSIDLREDHCAAGSVIMSGITHIPVAIHQNSNIGEDCFDLYCYSSFADALGEWLGTAARSLPAH